MFDTEVQLRASLAEPGVETLDYLPGARLWAAQIAR
jgi:hypothetical protein